MSKIFPTKLPFSHLYLDAISQKILIYIISQETLKTIDELHVELNLDKNLIKSSLDILLNKKPSAYIKKINNAYTINLTSNELIVFSYLNDRFIDQLNRRLIDDLFTPTIILSDFQFYLKKKFIMKNDDAVRKQLTRSFEKFVDLHFLIEKKINNDSFYQVNLDFFIHTSRILKIANFLQCSIAELKNNIPEGKLKGLSLHNFHLYFPDINNKCIDYDLLKMMIEKKAEKKWFIDEKINGNPCVYLGESTYGDYKILVYEGKIKGYSSITIIINQDKLKHAIPLSRLPFLIGEIAYLLNVENNYYFNKLDIENFNVNLIHYNFDMKLPQHDKYALFMKEVQKELTLGSYTDHFLFRFYQLIDNEYRFEAQVTKSSKSTYKTTVSNILNKNESDPIFRTIRGMMKNCVDIINNEIEHETSMNKLLQNSEHNTEKIREIRQSIRDFGSHFQTKFKEMNLKNKDWKDDLSNEVKSLSNEIINLETISHSHQKNLQNIDLQLINVLNSSDSSKNLIINLGQNLSDSLKIQNQMLSNMQNHQQITSSEILKRITNSQKIQNFTNEFYLQSDKKTRKYLDIMLRNLTIELETKELHDKIEDLKDKLIFKKKRYKLKN